MKTCLQLKSDEEGRAFFDAVVRTRISARAYGQGSVSRSLIEELLALAGRAPSNSNTQPWTVHVLAGQAKQQLSELLLASHERNDLPQSAHFPSILPPACRPRQEDFGERYYTALSIDRTDARARSRQTARNFMFFDAPVGLVFTIDERLTAYSWADFGMFLQTFMLAATSRGLATCPQVSLARHAPVIRTALQLDSDQTVVCGMALGHAEVEAPVNRMEMPREPLERFTVFHGFPHP